ncbi:hypothetical protein LTR84_008621 [Exophiala bonariae]|uniref:Transcription factor domain-containing protein n=1 Tax=Exophiala bonariae TaxID=1690606 RepID=A0AAV9MY05_9EURO|nr:hypothetical protein LTR84_008621 [Exophiala bonariae]
MPSIPINWTCPSLPTPGMPPTAIQHRPSTTTPSSNVVVSSMSVPVTPLQHPNTIPSGSPQSLPSSEELSHLCRFFVMNLIAHVPVVAETDVRDFAEMEKMHKQPLAYSMAYVAARFVPGCRSMRAMLVPEILSIVKTRFDHLTGHSEEQWTLLQAFAVLSTWAPRDNVELDTNNAEHEIYLSRDALRASMATLSRRWSLHRAGEEVTKMQNQKQDANHIRQSFGFRKYCYWLWLFASSHFHSMLTRTPPTVKEDATIRRAGQILQPYTDDEVLRQTLARVELCLIWSQIKLNDRELGEWWCSMSHETHATTILSVLQNLDEALHLWHRKWARSDRHQSGQFSSDVARNSSIDLSYRFVRFCVSVNVNKLMHTSSSKESVAAMAGDVITQSTARALNICQMFLEISPLNKSSVRFVPESTFSMIAFACEWIIRAKGLSMGIEYVRPNDLMAVIGVAETMVDVSIDSKHSARMYGETILSKLQQSTTLKMHSRVTQPWSPQTHPHSQQQKQNQTGGAPSPSHMSSNALLEAANAMDDVWPVQNPQLQSRAPLLGPPMVLAAPPGDGSNTITDYNASNYFQYNGTWSV